MASAQRSLDEVDVAREAIGVHGARVDRERRVDGLARAGIVARIEQHAGERREDLRVARPAGVRAAIRLGRAGESLPGRVRAARRSTCRSAKRDAPRLRGAFGVGRRMRLFERVFGLAQLGRAGRHAQVGLARRSAVRARDRAGDGRRIGVRGQRTGRAEQTHSRHARINVARVSSGGFQALECRRASERHSRKSLRAQQVRRRRRCACRWRRSAGSARRDRASRHR